MLLKWLPLLLTTHGQLNIHDDLHVGMFSAFMNKKWLRNRFYFFLLRSEYARIHAKQFPHESFNRISLKKTRRNFMDCDFAFFPIWIKYDFWIRNQYRSECWDVKQLMDFKGRKILSFASSIFSPHSAIFKICSVKSPLSASTFLPKKKNENLTRILWTNT